MKRAILLTLAIVAVLIAQTGSPVRISDDPAPAGVQKVLGYSGTNLIYVCSSPSFIANGTIRGAGGVSVSLAAASSTQASPTVIVVTHNFFNSTTNRPSITISGVTGAGYTGVTGINTTWVASVVDSTHLSIPFDSSALAAATWTAASYTTTAPRLNQPEWAVQHLVYDGSNNLTWTGWEGNAAVAAPNIGGSTSYNAKCSNASGTTVGVQ